MSVRVHRFSDRAELEAALAERLERALTDSSSATKAVMLSGGSTPVPVYRALAGRKPRAADGLVILFSDERHVPSDQPTSNYRQAWPLLEALALPEKRLLRVKTELPLKAAADDYAWQLAQLDMEGVRIGLGLLGLGADGHTASLFTPHDIERSRGRLAVAVQRPDGMSAVSVTPKLLAQVAEPLFVVAGADKREALAKLVREDGELVAWQAVRDCQSIEVWTEPLALP